MPGAHIQIDCKRRPSPYCSAVAYCRSRCDTTRVSSSTGPDGADLRRDPKRLHVSRTGHASSRDYM